MVNVSTGWREQRARLAADVAQLSSSGQVARNSRVAQAPLTSQVGQDATTRTMACPVCKALYTPAPAHQQLVLAPHIVLESAFMSMCHFCFRCRRAACPDCWDAVHGVCGACVTEAQLAFRTQVKPLSNAMPPLPQQQRVVETMHAAPVLVCIQHGRFYVKPLQPQPSSPSSPAQPNRMNRPMHIAPSEVAQSQYGRDSFSPSASNSRHSPSMWQGNGGRAEAVPTGVAQQSSWQKKPMLRIAPEYPKYAVVREENKAEQILERLKQLKQLEHMRLPIGWITEAMGGIKQWVTGALDDIERWVTGALLILLLTIVTMIVLAEASPSANAQIMHVLQIDIRSEVAYLIHLIGQL